MCIRDSSRMDEQFHFFKRTLFENIGTVTEDCLMNKLTAVSYTHLQAVRYFFPCVLLQDRDDRSCGKVHRAASDFWYYV